MPTSRKLTLHNGSPAGVTLDMANPSFSSSLSFYDGKIRAGSGALVNISNTIPSASQATGWVVGKYRVVLPGTGSYTLYYPIGDENYYAPVRITLPSGSILNGGALTAGTTSGDHGMIGSSLISPSHSINRVYSIDTSGGIKLSPFNTSMILTWNTADIDAIVTFPDVRVASYSGAAWVDRTITAASASGVTVVNLGNDIAGEYQAGERSAAPLIVLQPVNKSVCAGGNTSFTCAGIAGCFYRWQLLSGTTWSNAPSSGIYSGVSTSTLTLTAATTADNNRQYRCMIYNNVDTGYTYAATLTVNSVPTLSGSLTGCSGVTTAFSGTPTGGSWTSTAPGIAMADASGLSGIATGTATISYTLATGCNVTALVTVQSSPAAITGLSFALCTSDNVTLSCPTPGGVWSTPSSSASVSSSGVVSGVSAGTSVVSYSLTTGCSSTAVVTVNTTPSAITGVATVCEGNGVTLTATPAGGIWTSSNTAVGTVSLTTGSVTGIAAGTTTVSYILGTGCKSLRMVTVLGLPSAITGPASVCTGVPAAFSSLPAGGTWASSAIAIATAGTGGTVTGIAAGTAVISYTAANGCLKTANILVNQSPANLTGTLNTCVGGAQLISCLTPDGTWGSSDIAIATISLSGNVTAVSAGTSTISYMLPTGCTSQAIFTVNPLPAPIAGITNVCMGSTISLSSTTPGGSWSSSDTALAALGGSPGIVSGVAPGSVTITYTLPTSCRATAGIAVNPLPAAITGVLGVCEGAITTLANSTPGGTWSSSTPGTATVDAATGMVSGMVSGTTQVSYVLTATGCQRSVVVTVLPMPSAISGGTGVCKDATITLNNIVAGGTWSSSAPSVLSINAATGVATGMGNGAATVTYTLPGGCYTTVVVNADTIPVIIVTGPDKLCIGVPGGFSSSIAGGTWSSGNTALATVLSTGAVTGIAGGSVDISYRFSNICGTFNGSKNITVLTAEECDTVTSVHSASAALPSVDLFPNPNGGNFSVVIHTSFDEEVYLSIVNQVGQVVWSGSTRTNRVTNIAADIVPGLYTLRMHTRNGAQSIRFSRTQ